ncbi:nitrogen permease regulator 2-domain-containing protein [Naematelia encephala]|uniref:Nitrogen permease regulator 2-domain-containing protein n=1 Tax=Naematelia encephala TaxID=71784 RepID=A0A1Y2AUV1_9TREE|nr:nitrogen permease regulator 2-domain-containing protein [Naematelia encephala]
MSSTDESFLPQIVGLFYATFDPRLGPTVLHQVPENLITSTSPDENRSRSGSRSRDRSRAESPLSTFLDFSPISDYVIPKKSLHGKLVSLLTTGFDDGERVEYRIMGFPSVLTGEGGRYQRNEYMWNLCFVFHASSSLEAFEPVVRKCARILRSAELDSAYLSSPNPDHTPLPAVLEQLFEDLNSYSETSIPLDGFNSLELKLFPFFPNPPECEDWHVPIALVDLNALKDDNWDITAARVAEHINGVHHVRRIAQLADADPALTRETIRHMLYYQVVMMIDIFQYSNMYTLKPNITRLAADETIINECGAYVTRGGTTPSWPILLRLYSKLLPGVTVASWIESEDVLSLGVDPRRFVSFGIIKGFLRRVHRWPIMLEKGSPLIDHPEHTKRRVGFDKSTRIGSGATLSTKAAGGDSGFTRSIPAESNFTLRSMSSNASLGVSPSSIPNRTPPSAASKSPSRRPLHFTAMPRSLYSDNTHQSNSSKKTGATLRSGALKMREEQTKAIEEELLRMLNGKHHADEIQVTFGMSWSQLERVLGLDDIKEGRGKKGVTLILR